MFRELDNEDRIVKMENYSEKDGLSSGYVAFLHPKKNMHSSLFSPTGTNSIFMMVDLDEECIDKNILHSEKMKALLGRYIKATDDDQVSLDVFDDQFKDKVNWIPTFEDGFVSIQEKKNNVVFNGMKKYVIMAYATYPMLSKQFYQYLQKNIDANQILVGDFMEKDMVYKKFLDLAFRNIQKLIYNFSVQIGVKIKTVCDLGEFLKTSHNVPSLLAVPMTHWWINTLAKSKNNEYIYNNNVAINPYMLERTENNLSGIVLYNEIDMNSTNKCIIYPFLSGVSNKILLIKCDDEKSIGFPFYGLEMEQKDEGDSEYSIKHTKNIEKSFVVERKDFELEMSNQFTNYEQLFGEKYNYPKIHFSPVLFIMK